MKSNLIKNECHYNHNVCVITGASSGIGLETARLFSQNGWYVFALSKDKHKLINAIKSLTNCFPIICDVTDPYQIKKSFQEIREKQSNIKCLINCAGLGLIDEIFSITYNDWRNIIDTNLTGTFLCTKEALKYMGSCGVVVNIGSIGGKRGYSKSTAYCASKFGVVGLSESLIQDSINTDVRVILINPGLVDTPMSRELFPERSSKAISPVSIAKIIFFLVTELEDIKYISTDLYDVLSLMQ